MAGGNMLICFYIIQKSYFFQITLLNYYQVNKFTKKYEMDLT